MKNIVKEVTWMRIFLNEGSITWSLKIMIVFHPLKSNRRKHSTSPQNKEALMTGQSSFIITNINDSMHKGCQYCYTFTICKQSYVANVPLQQSSNQFLYKSFTKTLSLYNNNKIDKQYCSLHVARIYAYI